MNIDLSPVALIISDTDVTGNTQTILAFASSITCANTVDTLELLSVSPPPGKVVDIAWGLVHVFQSPEKVALCVDQDDLFQKGMSRLYGPLLPPRKVS